MIENMTQGRRVEGDGAKALMLVKQNLKLGLGTKLTLILEKLPRLSGPRLPHPETE